jgi:hypothetical protein
MHCQTLESIAKFLNYQKKNNIESTIKYFKLKYNIMFVSNRMSMDYINEYGLSKKKKMSMDYISF